jgi:alpha-tubulin suppressor-like RCC1 family protein
MGGFARLRLATGLLVRSLRAASTCLAALALGCTAEPPTQIVVSVNTDLAIGSEVDALHLVIQRKNSGGTFVTVRELNHTLGAGDELPLTLSLTRADKGSKTVRVEAEALRAGQLVVRRRAVAHFVTGRILGLPVNLVAACEREFLGCEVIEQTCNDRGICEPLERKSLSSWDGAPAFDPAPAPDFDAGPPDGGDGRDAGDTGGPIEGDHIVQLALGNKHSCALWESGAVQCWGGDDFGQLSSTFGDTSCPDPRENLCAYPRTLDIPEAVSLAAGDNFNCVVAASGEALCWGADDSGQLGDGPAVASDGGLIPVSPGLVQTVMGVQDADFVEAGGASACAMTATGPRCWGSNVFAQLRQVPDPLLAETAIKPDRPFDATARIGDSFACGVVSGAVVCWGDDHLGQLGADAEEPVTQEVAITGNGKSLSAGGEHVCALLNSNEVRCWGRNDYNQVGVPADTVGDCDDGGFTRACAKVPQIVGGQPRARALALGGLFSCLITDDAEQQVKCWGDNRNGIVEAGNAAIAFTRPVAVAGLKNARLIAAGRNHACAVVGTNDLHCWGSNEFGQLGPNAPLGSEAEPPSRIELVEPGGG